MKESSVQPGRLTGAELEGVAYLLEAVELVPLSCLFWWMDNQAVTKMDRTLPDDFIYVPVRGALDFKIESDWFAVEVGQLVIIPAGVRHGAVMAAGTDYFEAYALHFLATDKDHQPVLRRLSAKVGTLRSTTRWFESLAVCTSLLGKRRAAGLAYLKELLRQLLIEQVTSGVGLQALPEPLDARVTQALNQLRLRFAEDLRIHDLAAEVGLSPGRFRQVFRDSVGTSPKQYLQQFRLARARALLMTEPGLTVREIAHQVGFNDSHNFHTVYRQQFGETPRCTQRPG